MGISLKPENFTNLIAASSVEPIILNDLSSISADERALITRLTTTVYEQTDVFTNQPTCDCGGTSGGFNLGVICHLCRTPVVELFSQDLVSRVWIRAPNHVAPLINPIVWTMLDKKFTKSGFSLVEWLCNTDYQPNGNRPNPEIEELLNMGAVRGYNNFVLHFDEYFEMLCAVKHFAKKKDDSLKEMITMYRDCLFSQYIPLPNKALLIEEDTAVGNYVDPMVIQIINAIRTISGIDSPMASYTQRQRENRTIKTIVKLAAFYYESYHELMAKKQGLIRKQALGTRCHFTSRGVISSITKPHKYDELEISWGMGVTMLKVHLMNKLHRRGYTPNEATALMQEYTVKYSPLLDELFKEIIAEARDGGLYCIFVK